jgi:hypothetical protein
VFTTSTHVNVQKEIRLTVRRVSRLARAEPRTRRGHPTTGAAVTGILPPTSRFASDDIYGIKKQTVLDRLTAFFDRYFALG